MGPLDPPSLSRSQGDARYDGPGSITARALSARAPALRAPMTATPNLTWSSTLPSGTPTLHPGTTGFGSGGYTTSLNTVEFTFLGGKYVKASPNYPGYNGARHFPQPFSPGSYGSSVVEFISDAPLISFYGQYSELGTYRVLVDGAEVYRCGVAIRTGTAQAGTSTTVTLDSGASASNGYYNTRWLRITSGTGIGQSRMISGYVGSTKVATVSAAWTTTPDATSGFAVEYHRYDYNTSVGGGGWTQFDWAGERRVRRYRVETAGTGFYGIYTGALDTVAPSQPSLGTPTVWCGDSFGAGTYGDGAPVDGMAAIACRALGWELIHTSIGGTGFLNPGPSGLNYYDRLLPPTNAWCIFQLYSTAGNYTVTQGATTTTAIAYNATLAQAQSAFDTAFGSGYFTLAGTNGYMFAVCRTAPNSPTALTVNWSGLTGGIKYVGRYLGDIAPNVPTDGVGNPLPFNVVIVGGHNDTTASGYTATQLTTQATNLLNGIKATYPSARVFVIGVNTLPGGTVSTTSTNAQAAIQAAVNAALPTLRGRIPFIDTITTNWFSGTGYLGAQTGSGNSDLMCDVDGVHPTPLGHQMYGQRFAMVFGELLGKQINP